MANTNWEAKDKRISFLSVFSTLADYYKEKKLPHDELEAFAFEVVEHLFEKYPQETPEKTDEQPF